jgi:hypothetical protein
VGTVFASGKKKRKRKRPEGDGLETTEKNFQLNWRYGDLKVNNDLPTRKTCFATKSRLKTPFNKYLVRFYLCSVSCVDSDDMPADVQPGESSAHVNKTCHVVA